jgi:hypothetical protein
MDDKRKAIVNGLLNQQPTASPKGLAGALAQQTQPQGLLYTNPMRTPPASRKVWGYDMRDPYDTEKEFFSKNQHVGGMAAEDGRIVMNPYSPLSPQEREAVARNEAARLFMREKGLQFDFEATPEQLQAFRGTPYERDLPNLKQTLLARALTGDPSAGQLTPRQQQWVEWLRQQLEGR